MMAGNVNADLEAKLRLMLQTTPGQTHDIETVIDAGFTGFLTLPSSVIATLDLLWLCRQQGQLADGSIHVFDVFNATVLWEGRPRLIEVEAADADPLLGLEMMRGYELRMNVEEGGLVTISKTR